ncbi:MAG: phosphodiester glycosidase family protein [Chitinophagaceae bacterium]
MKRFTLQYILLVCFPTFVFSQIKWINVDSVFQPLPENMHVFKSEDSLNGLPNIAYYVIAPLQSKKINFTAEVGEGKRYTPSEYYTRLKQPLVVVNCTFFEFKYNQNLNVVVKNGELKAHNLKSIFDKKDSAYYYVTRSALGITKKRTASVEWAFSDSSYAYPYKFQQPATSKGLYSKVSLNDMAQKIDGTTIPYKKWKVETAVGGGPMLLKNGKITITNDEERMFSGKAKYDKHPRTAMGITANNELVILVVQGRMKGIAAGVDLLQEAKILKDIGCIDGLNLDGGGSSCMLINGKPTIAVSDKEGQRPVPAVFVIQQLQ